MGASNYVGPRGKVQVESTLRRERREGGLTLPEPMLRLAQAEYDRQFPGQPYERMQERGGLSLLEVVGLLCDRIERTEKLGPWADAER